MTNRPVWPPAVEIADILSQHQSQMALAENEHEIQTLASGRPDPSLGDGVGARRSEWGPDLRDAEMVYPPIENAPVAAVTVMDEKARCFTIPAAAFDDLLCRPFRRGMAGHLDMQDLAVGMTDRKENIEGLEPDRPHAEEIAGLRYPYASAEGRLDES